MRSKFLLLMLILVFGIIIFLFGIKNVNAACKLDCAWDDSGKTDCVYVGGPLLGEEHLGIIGDINQAAGSVWEIVASCSDLDGKCKREGFPTASNGQSCTAADSCLVGLNCNLCNKTGFWDANESQCVSCCCISSITSFYLRHGFTLIYADLFKFNIVDFYHLSVLICVNLCL